MDNLSQIYHSYDFSLLFYYKHIVDILMHYYQ